MKKRIAKTVQRGIIGHRVNDANVDFFRDYILPYIHIDYMDAETFDDIFDILDLSKVNSDDYDPLRREDPMGKDYVTETTGQKGKTNPDGKNRRADSSKQPKNNKAKVKLSQQSVDFIAKYMMHAFMITHEIGEDLLYGIYVAADAYDSFFAAHETKPKFVIDEKRSEAASKFTAEYENVVMQDKTFDFDDLNRRLGLI